MHRNDREARDVAGVGPYAGERENLVAMSTLASWKVSEGEPDIRGWEVRTVGNRLLGSVKDLLIDRKANEVVLLDIDLAGADRHSLVPIRLAHIDRAKRIVMLDSADLPDAEDAREMTTTRERHTADAGVVRYSSSRPVERAVDLPPAVDAAPVRTDDTSIIDRRVADRRIDRLGSDI